MDVDTALSEPPVAAAGSSDAGAGGADPAAPGLMERLEGAESLDATAAALREVLPDWPVTGRGRELLAGTWLGHVLHPLLTGFPLGGGVVLGILGGHLTTTRAVTRDNRLLDAPANRP